jgi:excisionase family DNA binding protein
VAGHSLEQKFDLRPSRGRKKDENPRPSDQVIRQMVKKGEIPGFKSGSRWRFNERELLAWIEAQKGAVK